MRFPVKNRPSPRASTRDCSSSTKAIVDGISRQFVFEKHCRANAVGRAEFNLLQPRNRCSHPYHAPCFLPHHHKSPMVAVFCCLLSTPWTSVKNDGWFEKSRRYS